MGFEPGTSCTYYILPTSFSPRKSLFYLQSVVQLMLALQGLITGSMGEVGGPGVYPQSGQIFLNIEAMLHCLLVMV